MADQRRPLEAARPADYRHCGRAEEDRVEICFSGRFDGLVVEWHAVIQTLQRVWRDRADGPARGRLRPFLRVGEITAGRARIEVGLSVDRIDAPTILKAVIMVRQYKRLRRGLQEFGEPVQVHR